MSLSYNVSRLLSNCFKHFQIFLYTALYLSYCISVLCDIFYTKKKINFMFKIIYLSILYSLFICIFLLLFFSKILFYFSPLWNYTLQYFFFFFFFSYHIIYKVMYLQSILLHGINHLFLQHDFKTLLKISNLIIHWIFSLIISYLICFTYSREGV